MAFPATDHWRKLALNTRTVLRPEYGTVVSETEQVSANSLGIITIDAIRVNLSSVVPGLSRPGLLSLYTERVFLREK